MIDATLPSNDKEPAKADPLEGRPLDDFVHDAEHLVTELLDKVQALPIADKDGKFKVRGAEEMYRQKDQIERKLVDVTTKIHELFQHAAVMLEELQGNMGVVEFGGSKVKTAPTQTQLGNASDALYQDFLKWKVSWNRLRETLAKCDYAIKQSHAKQFPGKIAPIAWTGIPDGIHLNSQKQKSKSTMDSNGKDAKVRDLIDGGPVKQP